MGDHSEGLLFHSALVICGKGTYRITFLVRNEVAVDTRAREDVGTSKV
jgi:hypothetical protein